MTERMRVVVADEELQALIPLLDELIFKKTLLTGDGFENLDKIREAVEVADVVESEVQATVDRLTDELMMTAEVAASIETAVQTTVDQLIAELAEAEVQVLTLKERFLEIDLPGVDRASRMILYRIPGLREALRLMYQFNMYQRTLGVAGIRGPLTAAVITLIYLSTYITKMQRRQDRLEAKVLTLERELNMRMITMEEAVRGYGELPQRYRNTVIS